MEERHFGVVKTFDIFKGFGFIQWQKGQDVFFFYQEIEADDKILVTGDQVSFTLEKKPKGWRALKVRKEG